MRVPVREMDSPPVDRLMCWNRRNVFGVSRMWQLSLLLAICFSTGCAAIPRVEHQPQFHNPFPQLKRVAVLPFVNLSDNPTVDQFQFAIAYHNELQQIRGFEVMPVGVMQRFLEANQIRIDSTTDFQKLAQALNVDAVLVGAVTDFHEYYPPRMGLSVNWYAANPSFHPIPPGYGLPWGRAEEEYIPEGLVFEAEFALAREQLKTQTPETSPPETDAPGQTEMKKTAGINTSEEGPAIEELPPVDSEKLARDKKMEPELPQQWPDPRGFIPPAPNKRRPPYNPQRRPIIDLVRQYSGHDADFTEKLADYYYFRDDARFGGWQSYLQRKDDFIRFCCYLHITETLSARGGVGQTRVVWRWPIDRYER